MQKMNNTMKYNENPIDIFTKYVKTKFKTYQAYLSTTMMYKKRLQRPFDKESVGGP